MDSLPKDIIHYILNLIPNINSLKLNKQLYSIVVLHPENIFWKNYEEDKVYKYGEPKMFDIIKVDLNKLSISCEHGNLNIVKYLVSQNADIHYNKEYPLLLASRSGNLDIVQYLVSQKADVHANEDIAVRWACESGHLEVVKYLVSQKANIHAYNDLAIILSSGKGHLDIVEYLVNINANVHTDNNFSLQCASAGGYLDVVKYLISQNANACDHIALDWANKTGHTDIATYFNFFS